MRAYATGLRERDRDAWIALFVDDASLVDPVPSDPHVGRAALETFWEGVMSIATEVDMHVGDLHVCGEEVAVSFEMTLASPSRRAKVRGIQILRLDDEARIVSSKSYWEPSSVMLEEPSATGSLEQIRGDGDDTLDPERVQDDSPRRGIFGRRKP